jgi:hypothetical protein
MNDEQVFQLLTETNPVPDVDAVAQPAALREIDRGRPTMITDTRTSTEPQADPKPVTGRLRRGPLVAAAAALMVLLAGGTMWATTGGGSELADQPGMSSVLAAYEAMNNGDVDGFYAQLTDRAIQADDHEFRSLEAEMHEETELRGPCRALEPSPTTGQDRIQCDVDLTNDFFRPAGILARVTDTFIIAENGQIDVLLYQFDDSTVADSYAHVFWQWLADTHPAAYEPFSAVRPETIPAFPGFAHRDLMLTALEYVDEFIAQSSQYPVLGSK